ncbi:MAG: heparinase II/III family protein [Pseudomonadota bacterium]
MTASAGLKDVAAALQLRARRDLSDFAGGQRVYRAATLSGQTVTGFAVEPVDLRQGDKGVGAALLSGRFGLAGETLQIEAGESLWDRPSPSRRFAEALHGFDWLRDLLSVDDPEALSRARAHFDDWISHFGRWNWFAWSPEVTGRRLSALAYAGPRLFEDETGAPVSARYGVVARGARRLARTAPLLAETRDRLDAAIALSLANTVFDLGDTAFKQANEALSVALKRQVLPDGGHVSRSPEAGAELFVDLAALEDAARRRGLQLHFECRRALDRLAPMARFFQLPGGALASFHGGGEGDAQALKAAARLVDAPNKSFDIAPHAGFHRIDAGGSVVIMDTGAPPAHAHARDAHASALAFEFAASGSRLVVNCGWSSDQPNHWRDAVRATAAHSALTLEETSSARLLKPGWRRDLLGPRISEGPEPVRARRNEEELGAWLEATHDGYRQSYGLGVRRRLFLAADGGDLRGEDGLYRPVEDGPPANPEARLQFALRFHLHPGVRASLSRDSLSALLVLPNGDGWRFRTDGGPVRLERSVYLSAGAPPQRSTQLVVAGEAETFGAGDRPPNRVRWAFQRLGRVGAAG